MPEAPKYLVAYHQSGRSLVCELDKNPYYCEFWALDELEQFNHEYQVPKYAPGYLGFATSGGGELFAVSPSGSVVCLPFVGMEPEAALEVAPDWSAFTRTLRNVL